MLTTLLLLTLSAYVGSICNDGWVSPSEGSGTRSYHSEILLEIMREALDAYKRYEIAPEPVKVDDDCDEAESSMKATLCKAWAQVNTQS